jgi:hypothetical protein
MSLLDARGATVQAKSPAVRRGAGSGANAPREWGFSAPELTTGPLIAGDFCVGRDWLDSEGAPIIAAETPQCAPSLSSHTSR